MKSMSSCMTGLRFSLASFCTVRRIPRNQRRFHDKVSVSTRMAEDTGFGRGRKTALLAFSSSTEEIPPIASSEAYEFSLTKVRR